MKISQVKIKRPQADYASDLLIGFTYLMNNIGSPVKKMLTYKTSHQRPLS